jgi:uncharacterized protein
MLKPRLTTTLSATALGLALTLPAVAQDMSERYAQWTAEAAAGDLDAAYELGVLYYIGRWSDQGGPEHDPEKAVELWLPVAEAGDARAQWRLGWAYETGSGVPDRDQEEAFRWYSAAAAQDFALAFQPLGRMNLDGRGTDPDPVRAYELFTKGAEAGQTRAMNDLARMYRDEGRGPVHDPERSVDWYRLSAEQDDSNGVQGLAHAYLHGIGVERDPIAALRVHVEFENRSGREQTNAMLRILAEMTPEEIARVDAVAEEEGWTLLE